MNTPSEPVQPEQNQINPLNVDFSHRIGSLSGIDYYTLTESVDKMSLRANAILQLLSDQFVIPADESDMVRASDEIIFFALEAVINELEDIRQLVSAYHSANKGDVQ